MSCFWTNTLRIYIIFVAVLWVCSVLFAAVFIISDCKWKQHPYREGVTLFNLRSCFSGALCCQIKTHCWSKGRFVFVLTWAGQLFYWEAFEKLKDISYCVLYLQSYWWIIYPCEQICWIMNTDFWHDWCLKSNNCYAILIKNNLISLSQQLCR